MIRGGSDPPLAAMDSAGCPRGENVAHIPDGCIAILDARPDAE
jgi:hypothetical protein